jgi:very-short-patch-repair endonuclease
VTTPARTIADLRRDKLPAGQLRRAIRQAEIQGLRLGPEVEADGTRSELERDFLRLCRRHGLPEPEVNVRVGRWTVDFLWRRERVAVETDGYAFHQGSVAFEDDHARDLDLRRRGYDLRRFTYRQVHDEPAQLAADLRDALALAS